MTVTPSCENGVAGRCVNSPGRGHHLLGGSDMPKGTPGRCGVCSIGGCGRPHLARGWCAKHYDRWKNHGDPVAPTPRELRAIKRDQAEERFWQKVVIPEDRLGCWMWTGASLRGYGRFRYVDQVVSSHRLSYELCLGPIPPGLHLDHLCRTPLCVNPLHLDPVTNAENTRRGVLANTTHCGNGHPYEMPIKTTPAGVKRCPTCERANSRKARDRRRQLKQTATTEAKAS
jgi:hypothetical protein